MKRVRTRAAGDQKRTRVVLLGVNERDALWPHWKCELEHIGVCVYIPETTEKSADFWRRRLSEVERCLYVAHSSERFACLFAALRLRLAAAVLTDIPQGAGRTMEGLVADMLESRYFGSIICTRDREVRKCLGGTANSDVRVIEKYAMLDELCAALDIQPRQIPETIRESRDRTYTV